MGSCQSPPANRAKVRCSAAYGTDRSVQTIPMSTNSTPLDRFASPFPTPLAILSPPLILAFDSESSQRADHGQSEPAEDDQASIIEMMNTLTKKISYSGDCQGCGKPIVKDGSCGGAKECLLHAMRKSLGEYCCCLSACRPYHSCMLQSL